MLEPDGRIESDFAPLPDHAIGERDMVTGFLKMRLPGGWDLYIGVMVNKKNSANTIAEITMRLARWLSVCSGISWYMSYSPLLLM